MNWTSLTLLKRKTRRVTPFKHAHFRPFKNVNRLRTGSTDLLITTSCFIYLFFPFAFSPLLFNHSPAPFFLCTANIVVPLLWLPRNAHLVLAVSSHSFDSASAHVTFPKMVKKFIALTKKVAKKRFHF